jgi:hypothetical protein
LKPAAVPPYPVFVKTVGLAYCVGFSVGLIRRWSGGTSVFAEFDASILVSFVRRALLDFVIVGDGFGNAARVIIFEVDIGRRRNPGSYLRFQRFSSR